MEIYQQKSVEDSQSNHEVSVSQIEEMNLEIKKSNA